MNVSRRRNRDVRFVRAVRNSIAIFVMLSVSSVLCAGDTDILCAASFSEPIIVGKASPSCREGNAAAGFIVEGGFVQVSDQKWLAIGEVSQEESTNAALAKLVTRRLNIVITSAADANVTLVLRRRGEAGTQTVVISREIAESLNDLRLAPGIYELRISMPGMKSVDHLFAVSAANIAGDALVSVLTPFPVLSGRVLVEGTGEPIANATVKTPFEERAISGKDGFFAAAITQDWPPAIRVEAAGFAPQVVFVPPSDEDVRLGDIKLGHGGAVAISLVHNGIEGRVEVIRKDDEYDLFPKLTRELAREDEVLRFGNVAPGTYTLRITGRGPLERYECDLKVIDDLTTERTVTLHPMRVDVEARLGERAFPNVRVVAKHRDAGWTGTIDLAASGRVSTTAWQPGIFETTAVGPGMGTVKAARPLDDSHNHWVIDLPAASLHGVVADEATGHPISGATVVLEQEIGGNRLSTNVRTDDRGRFVFRALTSGAAAITTLANPYLENSHPVVIRENQDTGIHVALRRGRIVHLQVLDERTGTPISNAVVLSTLTKFRTVTSGNGTATLSLPPKGSTAIFVIPPNGSIAAIDLQSAEGAEPKSIVISPGVAKITLRVLTEEGDPVRKAGFIFRLNGQVLPTAVVEALMESRAQSFTTDSFGTLTLSGMPEGLYEFWPLVNDRLVLQPQISRAPAPVTFVARPGLNFAEVVVRRVK